MRDFRFIWKDWDDQDVRDYILGTIYNAVLYAQGKEENGDYMVRLRVKGGGVYIGYWEDGSAGMRAAHVRIGSPALKTVSWTLDYTEQDTGNARLYWCPRKKGMPYSLVPESIYDREWCLYEGVYAPSRLMRWNPEGDDGKPMYKVFGEPRRDLVVDEMLERSKR